MRRSRAARQSGPGDQKKPPEPFSVRVPQALAMTGFSRSRLYELIKSGEIEIAKDGNCTFILVDSLKAAISRRVRRA
ncbi:helix-turn-helix domain-containing protein [Sphingomonas colocasiae]|uniref:Helix-turn-helix domain-containing protein n=1 Tax=Sphingomonas colocasiae TaxID=1848973 RepID=A0ABS7PPR5_9SPHN|nr:helix-turn-helix domain-containing protein [Sphingomonas colocasiae]MBY8823186.1 helix-turn-helix domain-containing protein [Sphingomonas colocasiae]